MTDDPKTSDPRISNSPRWLRVTLLVSLSLNLLIIGAFLGAMATGGGKFRGQGGPERFGGPLTNALVEEDKRKLKRQVVRKMIADREARRAHNETMTAIVSTLRVAPFDAGDLARHMTRLRDLVGRRFDTTQGILIAHIANMTDAERAALADRLEAKLNRRQ